MRRALILTVLILALALGACGWRAEKRILRFPGRDIECVILVGGVNKARAITCDWGSR